MVPLVTSRSLKHEAKIASGFTLILRLRVRARAAQGMKQQITLHQPKLITLLQAIVGHNKLFSQTPHSHPVPALRHHSSLTDSNFSAVSVIEELGRKQQLDQGVLQSTGEEWTTSAWIHQRLSQTIDLSKGWIRPHLDIKDQTRSYLARVAKTLMYGMIASRLGSVERI